jgi:hypothetical protein
VGHGRDPLRDRGKAARDAAGWHVCLDYLGYLLEETAAPWPSGERWSAVHPGYVEKFGPDAATMGPPERQEIGEGLGR